MIGQTPARRPPYGYMVRLRRIRTQYYEDAHDTAEKVYDRPPCEVGESSSDACYERCDERYEPSKLFRLIISFLLFQRIPGEHTYAIEIVARAKGSPTMCPTNLSVLIISAIKEQVIPKLNPRPKPRLPALASKLPFILRSDGDSRLPYDRMEEGDPMLIIDLAYADDALQ